MESVADVTSLVASLAFLHCLKATRAIPSGWMVTGFGPAGIKVFRAVSAGLPRIIFQPVRCTT